jgi:hypothetical protein
VKLWAPLVQSSPSWACGWFVYHFGSNLLMWWF